MSISNSREHQDFFVLAMTSKKKNGSYVEVGGSYPIQFNNTYLLEHQYDWRGVSIEWDQTIVNQWSSVRKNPCLCKDATSINYNELFQQYNLGPHIDYLQLDVDPSAITLQVLKLIDFSKFSFSIITYEHDWYQGGAKERDESRAILESRGYVRVVSDVMHSGLKFEDWYVHPQHIPKIIWEEYVGESVNIDFRHCDTKYLELFARMGLT